MGVSSDANSPGVPLTYFNDGGGGGGADRGSFFIPKKIPASFIDPKKSLLAKMSAPKKSFRPPHH